MMRSRHHLCAPSPDHLCVPSHLRVSSHLCVSSYLCVICVRRLLIIYVCRFSDYHQVSASSLPLVCVCVSLPLVCVVSFVCAVS